jgi:di/tricarboxylate transporter
VRDMARAGILLDLVAVILVVAVIATIYPLILA